MDQNPKTIIHNLNECVSKMPIYIQNVALIWREIFRSNQNNAKNKNETDISDNDHITNNDNENTSSNIDLLDIDW